jgi:hypothetical protein
MMWNRDMPHFDTWEYATLARFAEESYRCMQDDKLEIEKLRLENKRLEALVADLQQQLTDDWK